LSPIVIDTSAILAILRDEPEKDAFLETILAAWPRFMSAVNFQEVGMVIAGQSGDERTWLPLNALLTRLEIEIVAHDALLARAAQDVFLRYGKGRHPARLNFADCAAYALARTNDVPLLFKGQDFAKTDIHPASSAP
jgi:ribonuclease VapC